MQFTSRDIDMKNSVFTFTPSGKREGWGEVRLGRGGGGGGELWKRRGGGGGRRGGREGGSWVVFGLTSRLAESPGEPILIPELHSSANVTPTEQCPRCGARLMLALVCFLVLFPLKPLERKRGPLVAAVTQSICLPTFSSTFFPRGRRTVTGCRIIIEALPILAFALVYILDACTIQNPTWSTALVLFPRANEP